MSTPAQIQANQQNSLKSTGPKTAVGKLIASRNSTRHGLYSTTVLLPDEGHHLSFARARPSDELQVAGVVVYGLKLPCPEIHKWPIASSRDC